MNHDVLIDTFRNLFDFENKAYLETVDTHTKLVLCDNVEELMKYPRDLMALRLISRMKTV